MSGLVAIQMFIEAIESHSIKLWIKQSVVAEAQQSKGAQVPVILNGLPLGVYKVFSCVNVLIVFCSLGLFVAFDPLERHLQGASVRYIVLNLMVNQLAPLFMSSFDQGSRQKVVGCVGSLQQGGDALGVQLLQVELVKPTIQMGFNLFASIVTMKQVRQLVEAPDVLDIVFKFAPREDFADVQLLKYIGLFIADEIKDVAYLFESELFHVFSQKLADVLVH